MFEKEAEEYFETECLQLRRYRRTTKRRCCTCISVGYNKAKEEIRKELLGRRPDNE